MNRAEGWLPSQRFLVLGAADWLLMSAAYTATQPGLVAVHSMLFSVGILMAIVGLLHDSIVRPRGIAVRL